MRVARGFLPALAFCAAVPAAAAAQPASGPVWLKGSLHTHTDRSDGDTAPEVVVRWYREHGYGFLAITDHDRITEPAPLAEAAGPDLLLVPAEEVTGLALPSDGRKVPVHVNAFVPREVIPPFKGGTPAEALAQNVARARAAGALVLVNHPNFGWALTADDLKAAAPGFRLLEIFSGHPLVHFLGGGGALSAEALWDALLTAGHRVHGAAVDDSHHFAGECTPARACPGRGWVVVRVAERTPAAVLAALERGDFYASNGVALRDVRATEASLELTIEPQKSFRYRTEFVGSGGRVLASIEGESASWRFRGDEGYVRARVTDSMGRRAWTQPVFVPDGGLGAEELRSRLSPHGTGAGLRPVSETDESR
jgi:hypothetical protein